MIMVLKAASTVSRNAHAFSHGFHPNMWSDWPLTALRPSAGLPISMVTRRPYLRAKVMASLHALVTVPAATGIPADADTLANLESLGIRTDGRDAAAHLVAENRGVLRNAPIVV